ncbi:hypothetical protein BLNAU_3352 [Blattamonas nauphoetae]|uniref:Uncharacterized protein n=1 Tax=Blattamonas nauphoetae TaxID=2049346 RepID=A0ABQ9YCV0_9EUKA|nr:hypothetical protein BLNAU_3352 [Blattamonas nauphoetae]
MGALLSNTSPSRDDTCTACSPFLNWDENELKSVREQTVVFQSLVATVKLRPALDVSLETKAVRFLESVPSEDEESADAFLGHFASFCDESLTDFTQSVEVLISSTNQTITTAAMKMFSNLIRTISPKFHLTLIKAGFIPQLIITLNPSRSVSQLRLDSYYWQLKIAMKNKLFMRQFLNKFWRRQSNIFAICA